MKKGLLGLFVLPLLTGIAVAKSHAVQPSKAQMDTLAGGRSSQSDRSQGAPHGVRRRAPGGR